MPVKIEGTTPSSRLTKAEPVFSNEKIGYVITVSVYFIGLFYPDAIRNKTITLILRGIPLRPHRAFWYKRAGKRWVRIT